jgi:hypothetical protein
VVAGRGLEVECRVLAIEPATRPIKVKANSKETNQIFQFFLKLLSHF